MAKKIILPDQEQISQINADRGAEFTGLLDADGRPILKMNSSLSADDLEGQDPRYSSLNMTSTEGGLAVPSEQILAHEPDLEDKTLQTFAEAHPLAMGAGMGMAILGALSLAGGCAAVDQTKVSLHDPVQPAADQPALTDQNTSATQNNAASEKQIITPDQIRYNGLMSRENPSLINVGFDVSQMHEKAFASIRLLDYLGNSPIVAELNAGAKGLGTFFRGEDGQYQMPNGGHISLAAYMDFAKVFDLNAADNGKVFNDIVVAPGIFAQYSGADFTDAMTRSYENLEAGIASIIMAKRWQVKGSASYLKKNKPMHYGINENLEGGQVNLETSLDLGRGWLVMGNLGFTHLEGDITGTNGRSIEKKSQQVPIGLGVYYSPTNGLQIGVFGNYTWENTEHNVALQNSRKDLFTAGITAKAYPLRLFKLDSESGLYLAAQLFDNYQESKHYRDHDLGVGVAAGLEFGSLLDSRGRVTTQK